MSARRDSWEIAVNVVDIFGNDTMNICGGE